MSRIAPVDPYTKKAVKCTCGLHMEIGGANDALYICTTCGHTIDRVTALELRIEELEKVLSIMSDKKASARAIRVLTTEEAQNMISDIEELRQEKLTIEELDFFSTIKESIFPNLTVKMSEWLNIIYDRVMR
jgi:nitrogen regulatory protein PII-like uncharacterized protein